MSFGFDDFEIGTEQVKKALIKAQNVPTVVFAATSNEGNHKQAAWPARSDSLAIGIHSCNDEGTEKSKFTPRPIGFNRNFMAVGENVLSHWKDGGYIVASGTSFATPVATAMAALVLAFMNQTIYRANADEVERMKASVQTVRGMVKVMESMSIPSSDKNYLWISSKLLWEQYYEFNGSKKRTPRESRDHGWNVIKEALRE